MKNTLLFSFLFFSFLGMSASTIPVDLGADTVVCDSMLLDAYSPDFVSYSWNTNDTTSSIVIYTTGLYSVIVTDSTGCTGTDTIQVVVNPSPVFDLGPDMFVCDSAIFDAGFVNVCRWSFPSPITPTYTLTDTGIHKVWMEIEALGCKAIDTVIVELERSPVAYFTFNWVNFGYEYEFFNHSLYADSVIWDFGDGQTSTEWNPVHEYQFNGQFFTTLIVFNNCGTDTIGQVLSGWSIEDELFSQSIELFPNLTNGIFWIESEDIQSKNLSLEIHNLQGQILLKKEIPFAINQLKEKVNLSNFPKGIYIIKIEDETRTAFKRILLE